MSAPIPSTSIQPGWRLASRQRERAGLKPRAIIAVDLFGLPADYDAIQAFADAHGLLVIADAAQSFGATYKASAPARLAEITATSFFPAKPLGCYGDGGAIFTDDDDLAEVMRSIRLHGKGGDKYDIVRIGMNGRLDTLQAAILLVKLAIFADELAAKDQVAAGYTAALAGIAGIHAPMVPAGYSSAWAQYTLRTDGGRRDALAGRLAAAGVPTQVYYPRPLSAQIAYRRFPAAVGGTPIAAELAGAALSLPMHAGLDAGTLDRITAGFW